MSDEQTAISRLGVAVVNDFGGVWVNASDVREAMREISRLRRVVETLRAFVLTGPHYDMNQEQQELYDKAVEAANG